MRTQTLMKALALLLLLPLTAAAEKAFDYTYFDVAYANNGMEGAARATDDIGRTHVGIGDGDGVGIRASLALDRNIHVFASYTGTNMDINATRTVAMPSLDDMRAAFFTAPGSTYWDALCDFNGDKRVNFLDLAMLGDAPLPSHAAVDGDMTDWRVGLGYNRLLTARVSGFVQLFWDFRDLDFAAANLAGETHNLSGHDNGIGASVGLRSKLGDRLELMARVSYTPVGDVSLLAENPRDMFRNDTLYGLGAEFAVTDRFSVCAEVEGDGDARGLLLAARYSIGN